MVTKAKNTHTCFSSTHIIYINYLGTEVTAINSLSIIVTYVTYIHCNDHVKKIGKNCYIVIKYLIFHNNFDGHQPFNHLIHYNCVWEGEGRGEKVEKSRKSLPFWAQKSVIDFSADRHWHMWKE